MVTKTWATLKTTRADVQPANLTENEVKLFGISSQQSNSKKIFFESDASIVEGLRAYTGGTLYDIRGGNGWDIHGVVLGIPVIGETYTPGYSVTYLPNGATSGTVPVDSSVYLPGATVTILNNTGGLARPGYTFTGWAFSA